MKHLTLTVAILMAAILFYVAGWVDGSVAVLATASVFELIFWSRIFRRRGLSARPRLSA